jgi:hypothetical protein
MHSPNIKFSVIWRRIKDVSEEHASSIFRGRKVSWEWRSDKCSGNSVTGILRLCSTFFRDVDKYLPVRTATNLRRHTSSYPHKNLKSRAIPATTVERVLLRSIARVSTSLIKLPLTTLWEHLNWLSPRCLSVPTVCLPSGCSCNVSFAYPLRDLRTYNPVVTWWHPVLKIYEVQALGSFYKSRLSWRRWELMAGKLLLPATSAYIGL